MHAYFAFAFLYIIFTVCYISNYIHFRTIPFLHCRDEYDKTSRRERDNISPTNVDTDLFATSSNTHFSIAEMVKRRKAGTTSIAETSSLGTTSTRKVGAYDGKSSVGDNSDGWDR